MSSPGMQRGSLRRWVNTTALAAAMSLVALPLAAQTGTVTGRVTDAATGAPCADFGNGGVVDLRVGLGRTEPGEIYRHNGGRGLYFKDPDGLLVEVYADVMDDWRAHRKGIINKEKPKYIPGVTSAPVAQKLYPKDPELDIVKEAVFHPKKVTHVALVTPKFEEERAMEQVAADLEDETADGLGVHGRRLGRRHNHRYNLLSSTSIPTAASAPHVTTRIEDGIGLLTIDQLLKRLGDWQ